MGKKKNKREYIENYLATVGKKREETNNVEKVESAKLKYGYLYKCSSYIKNIFDLGTKRGKILAFGIAGFFAMTLGFALSNYVQTGATVGGTVATYKGGYIKGKALYEYYKNSLDGSNLVKTTLLYQTFGDLYGDKISDEEINTAFPNYRNAGLKTLFEKGDSTNSIRTLVKQQLALQYGLKEKMEVSQREMSDRWKVFHPKMKVQMVMVADEAQANDIATQLGQGVKIDNFLKVDQSGLNGQTATIKSNTEQLSQEELEQLQNTKEGEATVIKKDNVAPNGSIIPTYYVFKVLENPAKGTNIDSWKEEVKELIQEDKVRIGLGQKQASEEEANKDAKAVRNAIKSVFKERNVRISDPYMKKALSDYLGD